jgi:mRNA interferase MazF
MLEITSQDFNKWNSFKKQLEFERKIPEFFNAAEVWWCAIGINVGFEQIGKNEYFERPVLILRKYNKELFFGVPLTSQNRSGKFYYKLPAYKKDETEIIEGAVILSQGKTFSSKRLLRKLYELNETDFCNIVKKHNKLLSEKSKTPAS